MHTEESMLKWARKHYGNGSDYKVLRRIGRAYRRRKSGIGARRIHKVSADLLLVAIP